MKMTVRVHRYFSTDEATSSVFAIVEPPEKYEACFSLEDQHQTVKVYGETRIPAGVYRLGINTNAYPPGDSRQTFHQRYGKRFGAFHRGMIEILNVPGFTNVLIHIGNDDGDTAGCLLLGENSSLEWVGNSTGAYKRLYPPIIEALLAGDDVWIEIEDHD